ncbi:MAG: Type III secretion needle MxiH like [Roseibaca calidilacus]|uniref:Type III secretion needle MxiH like n=1 Tax=Roseibaca calidilacus TaxID=1666912 RepID=A0A0P7W6X1_9RHOB|nr:hypothetical protein [Roseibaca calidilacus]KPP92682.1 MAG: Type III secretion needle MxiH like [Roseibaca calidilacus]CUX80245.1 hypothetical protein Ga0058931_0952 [Roseibaca calidilacus]
MGILADIAIGSGALLAAAYCMLLSRRLRAFTRLDGDVGRAIALLSKQVDQLTQALSAAEAGSAARERVLREQITAAEQAARRLELLMAADRPHAGKTTAAPPSADWSDASAEFEPLDRARAPEQRLRMTRTRTGTRA